MDYERFMEALREACEPAALGCPAFLTPCADSAGWAGEVRAPPLTVVSSPARDDGRCAAMVNCILGEHGRLRLRHVDPYGGGGMSACFVCRVHGRHGCERVLRQLARTSAISGWSAVLSYEPSSMSAGDLASAGCRGE